MLVNVRNEERTTQKILNKYYRHQHEIHLLVGIYFTYLPFLGLGLSETAPCTRIHANVLTTERKLKLSYGLLSTVVVLSVFIAFANSIWIQSLSSRFVCFEFFLLRSVLCVCLIYIVGSPTR